jgi:hypothetical protein
LKGVVPSGSRARQKNERVPRSAYMLPGARKAMFLASVCAPLKARPRTPSGTSV